MTKLGSGLRGYRRPQFLVVPIESKPKHTSSERRVRVVGTPRRVMKEHAGIRNKKECGSLGSDDHFLTNRETKVLQMVTAGYSDAKIAEELCISSLAVEIHLHGLWLRGTLSTDEYLRQCRPYEFSRNRQEENDDLVVNGLAHVDI